MNLTSASYWPLPLAFFYSNRFHLPWGFQPQPLIFYKFLYSSQQPTNITLNARSMLQEYIYFSRRSLIDTLKVALLMNSPCVCYLSYCVPVLMKWYVLLIENLDKTSHSFWTFCCTKWRFLLILVKNFILKQLFYCLTWLFLISAQTLKQKVKTEF